MFAAIFFSLPVMVGRIRGPAMTAAWNNVAFGQTDPEYIVHHMPGIIARSKPLLASVIGANLPQLLLAIPCVLFTGCFPVLYRNTESRRTLLLMLAFLVSVLFALLGWFVSQSLFPVQFMWYTSNGAPWPEFDIISEGYTLKAATASFVTCAVLISVLFSLRCFPSSPE